MSTGYLQDEPLETDPKSQRDTAAFLKYATRLGWEIDWVNELGVCLRMKKRFSEGLFLLGACTLIIGIGLLFWLYGSVQYLTKTDRVMFIPKNELHRDTINESAEKLVKSS